MYKPAQSRGKAEPPTASQKLKLMLPTRQSGHESNKSERRAERIFFLYHKTSHRMTFIGIN
jgi:hypothetical protein